MSVRIAIVGLSCRFPGARDYHQFWQNLEQDRSSIRQIDPMRWRAEDFVSDNIEEPGKTTCPWYGQVDDIDAFDHAFFAIAPREARQMDPQQRLLLEEVWHCLEDAGMTRAQLRLRRAGVFVGSMASDHRADLIVHEYPTDGYSAIASYDCIMANRVSFFLGLDGPSYALDAACASSMVALHQARRSLQNGECGVALVAGACLHTHPWKHISYAKARMLSPDGRCKTFDKEANGYVPGDGVAVLLLQELSAAEADNRHIYAIIEGSATNHGGAASSLTAPRVAAQCEVISRALEDGQIDARKISYVEAHGTGTSLGDPIEIEALVQAFRRHTQDQDFCKIGSVKTNIGHLEAASGLAGVIKVLLMIQHQHIPASLNLTQLNPILPLSGSPFAVARHQQPWNTQFPRRAGISSFGFGGVNGHAVLCEHQQGFRPIPSKDASTCHLFLLSAKTPEALQNLVASWRVFTQTEAFASLRPRDISATLLLGREHFRQRIACTFSDLQSLRQALAQLTCPEKTLSPGCTFRLNPSTMSGFPSGKLAPLLTQQLERVASRLKHQCPKYARAFKNKRWPAAQLDLYRFCASYAQLRTLSSLGIAPNLLVGHGHGFLLALVHADMITLEKALAHVSGSTESITLNYPSMPLLDPLTAAKINPFTADEAYLKALKAALPDVAANHSEVFELARQLLEHQFTFRIYVDEWQLYLEQAGISPNQAFEPGYLEHLQPSQRLLLLIVAQSSLQRLYRKWDLSPKHPEQDPALRELVQLVVMGVIRKPVLAVFLFESEENWSDLAAELCPCPDLFAHKDQLPLLNQHSQQPINLGADWLNTRLASPLPDHFPEAGLILNLNPNLAHSESQLHWDAGDAQAMHKALAELWRHGLNPDWNALETADYRFAPLPTYVFDKHRFWWRPEDQRQPASSAKVTASSARLWQPVWEPISTASEPAGAGPVLAFASDFDTLAREDLRRDFQNLYMLSRSAEFINRQDGVLQFDPHEPKHFDALLAQIWTGKHPAEPRSLTLLAMANPQPDPYRDLHFLFMLSRALLRAELEVKLRVVTCAAFRVHAHDLNLGYRHSTLEGFALSLNAEQRRVHLQIVDTDKALGLKPEDLPAFGKGATLALRSCQPYQRKMIELKEARPATPYRDGATILIVGGAGGLGLQLCQDLAQRGRCRLALLGRSPLNPNTSALIASLKAKGTPVLYVGADISDPESSQNALNHIRSEWGPIHGVIHAAGHVSPALVQNKTWQAFTQTLAPKCIGVEVLDRLTRQDPLDFFVLCSSVTSLMAYPGLADYAAANAFLDSFAQFRTQSDAPGKTLVINYSLWQDGGMGQNENALGAFQRGTGVLSSAAGLDAFYQALASGQTQVMVCGSDWNPPHNETLSTATIPASREPLPKAFSLEPLRLLLSNVLHIPPHQLDKDCDLRDLGLDSLALNEFADKIKTMSGVNFNAALLFECPTLDKIAGYLAAQQPTMKPKAPTAQPNATPLQTKACADDPDRIAIIGMAGRFPGADHLDHFWENLVAGKDQIREVIPERWDWRDAPSLTGQATNAARYGGFIADLNAFDAAFFKIPPKQADLMDPQHRILMEDVWHALEDACILPRSLAGSDTGLFVGVSNEDYLELMAQQQRGTETHATTGTYTSMIPNRISYFLDIHGPSLALNTACSSSLVAIHQAVTALKQGECKLALAGGVNALLAPRIFYSLAAAGMLAANGRCKTFDAAADGYVRGEGSGMVVLRPLADAMAAGNPIHGVILASAINHGGFANSLTAPNPKAQAELLVRAYTAAAVPIDSITHIETHGTGTALGDPIEVNALKRAFAQVHQQQGRPQGQGYCSLGALKSHIGHLESAAGVAGLIKVLLSMRHRYLPGNLHQTRLNPLLELDDSPFQVLNQGQPWESAQPGEPLRAGISSFGFGGVNAHLVISSFAVERAETPAHGPVLVVLSARNLARLQDSARQLLRFLHTIPNVNLIDLSYTLQVAREGMEERLAVFTHNLEDLTQQLDTFAHGVAGNYHHGQASDSNTESLLKGRAGAAFMDVLLADGELQRLGALWVKGAEVPWPRLHDHKPRLISLPGYAFAKTHHGLSKLVPKRAQIAALHPLLDHNLSTMMRQVYGKLLTADQFFLADHRVGQWPVLPGVAYIEMARAAAERACEQEITLIRDVTWMRPISLEHGPLQAEVELKQERGFVSFEVHTPGPEGVPILHARGELLSLPEAPKPQRQDLASIRARCGQQQAGPFWYARFIEQGIDYGPCFQAIQTLHWGPGESLAHLRLPDAAAASAASFGLHPSLLDGALQSVTALVQQVDPSAAFLPFSLDQLQLYAPLATEIWVHARMIGSVAEAQRSQMPLFNLDLISAQGEILARLDHFALRAFKSVPAQSKPVTNAENPAPVADGHRAVQALSVELVQLAARVLGLDATDLDPVSDMREFGFDSITLTELTHAINAQFHLDLSPALLFDHSNLKSLASAIAGMLPKGVSEPFAQTATEPSPATLEWADRAVPTPRKKPDRVNEPIAIIGMAAVLPQSPDLESFWQNLSEGRSLISEVPANRWDWRELDGDPAEGFFSPVRFGGFVENIDAFDAPFFGIADLEAKLMDPQQRIFLQTAWHAIEDAGYGPHALAGSRTAVFAAVANADYLQNLRGEDVEAHTATGWAHSILPNRLSYLLNLRGTSETVDTACSAALVALHRAVAVLRSGECDQAIVGGVNLISTPWLYVAYSKGGMLSRDGRCKSFDQRADGYVRSEGVGVLLLKPLQQARRDGDPIRALICGSAVNHGGRAQSLTAPNAPAQAEVIFRAQLEAGFDPDTLDYIEAHGTGTPLGDPIEINGIKLALQNLYAHWHKPLPTEAKLLVGSAKANLGHLESAAGIVGVIKVVLAMQHQQLPGNPELHTQNPFIQLEDQVLLIRETQPWPATLDGKGRNLARRAGVSSFGFGGVNAHVALESWSEDEPTPSPFVPVFVLSANSQERLKVYAEKIRNALQGRNLPFAAVLGTLQAGRDPRRVRLAIVCERTADLLHSLERYLSGLEDPNCYQGVAGVAAKMGSDSERHHLAKAWSEGAQVDWPRPMRRVSLPGYPFAPLRYWPNQNASLPVPAPAPGKASGHHLVYYHPVWRVAAFIPQRATPGPVLVFASTQDPLLATLKTLGPKIILVSEGKAFTKHTADHYSLDLLEMADCEALGRDFKDTPHLAVIYLHALRATPDRATEPELLRHFNLIQGLRRSLIDATLAFACPLALKGGHAAPESAALSAFYHTLSNEEADVSATLLEQDDLSAALPRLVQEIGRPGFRHLRLVAGHLSERTAQPLSLQNQDGQEKRSLPAGAVCLITGGAGGLGLILARNLAQRHQAQLVLTGRSELNPAQKQQLAELEAMGSSVLYLKADVTDASQMAAVIEQTHRRFGPIQAVFHAAGLIRDGLFQNKSISDFLAVITAKISGSLILDRITASEPLEQFVLFSSLSAIVGNPGQTDYACANGFMNAFAAQRQRMCTQGMRRGKTVAVNWPLWAEGGMQIEARSLQRLIDESGIHPLETAAGIRALDFALSCDEPCVIPLYGEPERIEAYFKQEEQARSERMRPKAITPAPPVAALPINGASVSDYLTTVVATALKTDPNQLDPQLPFSEYGVDSFLTLKIINRLEKDMGRLPKSVLFEHGNLDRLGSYLKTSHSERLAKALHKQLPLVASEAPPISSPPTPAAAPQVHLPPAPEPPPAVFEKREMLLLSYSELAQQPQLQDQVKALLKRYDGEAAISRGTRDISPYLFFGACGTTVSAFFNINFSSFTAFAYAYVGPDAALPSLAEELLHWSRERGLDLTVLSETPLTRVGVQAFTATPFGASQRLLDIRNFTLEGTKMRRLRYLVNKFEKVGSCRTCDYLPGTDRATDQAIAAIIDRWCASKTQVNPMIARVRAEICDGTLDPRHRIFLTYLDDVLQNAILLTSLQSQHGYMMDLEFYPAEMPLGGLEYAICQIIAKLRDEGYTFYSLGGTYGAEMPASPDQDPKLAAHFAQMRERDDFGAGNFQFKNKFRPTNTTLYLCRPEGSSLDSISDILLMIADPDSFLREEPETESTARPAQQAPQPEPTRRQDFAAPLRQHGFNPMLVPDQYVGHDLKTDSWAQLSLPHIAARMSHLAQRADAPMLDQVLMELFSFDQFALCASGRQAEELFYSSLNLQATDIVQNIMFPTALFAQIGAGLNPLEMPDPEVWHPERNSLFCGGIDLARLGQALSQPHRIGAVVVEVGNNASGGMPVSLASLGATKALCHKHQLPLVLDITRIVENASLIKDHEPGYKDLSIWQIVRQICALADHLTASLAKDFTFKGGGLIASRDTALIKRLQTQTTWLTPDRALHLARAMADRSHIEGAVRQRMNLVQALSTTLRDLLLPTSTPVGGHCVLLDVGRMEVFAATDHPQQNFLSWLYQHTGIRAGIHSAGSGKGTYLQRCVRFAVPVGLTADEMGRICSALKMLFQNPPPIEPLRLETPKTSGLVAMARFSPINRAHQNGQPIATPAQPLPIAVAAAPQPTQPPSAQTFAIVGMAGRYPDAPDLDQFWANLCAGRDSIREKSTSRPDYRPALREDGQEIPAWGAWIDEIDCFDARFFHISPRDAEHMDPQERIFLETAWATLESAGYTPETLPSREVGVYVGVVWSGYQMLSAAETEKGNLQVGNSWFWAIANRVSYALDLKGPSLATDTACSSSLMAIHLACEALAHGEIQAALAGGINLDLHPHKRLITGAGGTLSPDGRCFTFGARANGYVAGEGVGAVMLKTLAVAERDGDQIHALIRASATNHGGKGSGFVVPNPAAQADLIMKALSRAGVDAATISAIEAHGTGTRLGDPVEIDGLQRAFASVKTTGCCALSSVKTNIGHLEAAAGIAGLTKLVLQMRHGERVPTLHADPINPFIELAGTPFYIQAEYAPWPRTKHAGVDIPRRAGLSSFGAGGVNVHLIVEEAPPAKTRIGRGPQLIVLSAASADLLRLYAGRLATRLSQLRDQDLPAIAFTLRQGRRSLNMRFATVAEDLKSLSSALQAYQNQEPAGYVSGKRTARKQVIDTPSIKGRDDLWTLANSWVTGEQDQLGFLDQDSVPDRIDLPTYPFERRRYWIKTTRADAPESASPAIERPTSAPAPGPGELCHPLLDRRLETSEGLIFLKRFAPGQFVFRDHIVLGTPTLPGVGYLEMAVAAARLAGLKNFGVKNHVWASPITAENHPDIQIQLKHKDVDSAYEISTTSDQGKLIHAQGRLTCEHTPQAAVNLAELQARMPARVSRTETYANLEQYGLTYGEELRSISFCLHNDQEQLTRLDLPESLLAEFSNFDLHPAIMDGAVQSVVVLLAVAGLSHPFLPFLLPHLEVYAPLQPKGYAWLTRKADLAGGSIRRFDVRLLDEAGNVLLLMRDFSLKELVPENKGPWYFETRYQAQKLTEVAPLQGRILVLSQGTAPEGLPENAIYLTSAPDYSRKGSRFALDLSSASQIARFLDELSDAQMMPDQLLHLFEPQDQLLTATLPACLAELFELLRGWLARSGPLRLLSACKSEGVHAEHGALVAFFRTLQQEHPGLSSKLLTYDQLDTATLLAELADQSHDEVLYLKGSRQISQLQSVTPRMDLGTSLGRPGAVYLITGGCGGLGLIFARALAQNPDVKLALVGRTPTAKLNPAPLRELELLGATVTYISADVCEADQATAALQQCRQRFGRVDGLIHTAGVLHDGLFLKKRAQTFAGVLAPKLRGSQNLDRASASDPLDFFVMCSSLAAVTGNRGQCDYAYANRFMDLFADQREQLCRQGQRSGKTLSINWPLWRDGGMSVDPSIEKLLARTTGMIPLASSDGIEALRQGLAANASRWAVVDGDHTKLLITLGLSQQPVKSAAPKEATRSLSFDLEAMVKELVNGMQQILKVEPEDVQRDADLAQFGFDSLSFTDFTNFINETFTLDLTPVIFYEYETLDALLGYLVGDFADQLPARFRCVKAILAEPVAASAAAFQANPPVPRQSEGPVAIIGMAAVMPGSADLDRFWENLRAGRDLISEIPADRWDWRQIYGDPLVETHKTNIKWGGFMPEIDRFDAAFFGISAREAVLMDPQQRIFLETVWKAVEDAGYSAAALKDSATGLFVGSGGSDYHDLLVKHEIEVGPHSATGQMHSVLANRVSYLLGLRGPSEPVETACSSALVALHRALVAIYSGDCDQAIVGGVSLIADSDMFIGLAKASMLCEDGRCKTFDHRANGYVRGEGIGAILIKRLERAEADGDSIRAVIRGSATNHGGHANSLTAPNLNAQAEVILAAHRRAAFDPSTIGYIEAHGTGTALGDPIEINALKKAFRELYQDWAKAKPLNPHCLIGSVKTNIGHLELSSGMAGLLKVVLSMQHQTLPAHLHLEQQNPYVQLEGSPFALVADTIPWPAPRASDGGSLPRRAGVSSFGFGGVNAHIVLEEYLPPARVEPKTESQVFLLSAKDPERLAAYALDMISFLEPSASSPHDLKIFRDRLQATLAQQLNVDADQLDPSEDLSEYGVDAQTLLALVRTLHEECNISPRLEFHASTLDELAQSLQPIPRVRSNLNLTDLAYTSQVGRDAHAYRLAILTSSLGELRARLQAWSRGEQCQTVYQGQQEKGKKVSSAADALYAQRNLAELAALWTMGAPVDWSRLNQGEGRRIAMPTYPFARKRYWFQPKGKPTPVLSTGPVVLGQREPHEQGFRWPLRLEPSAFYLAEHVIEGKALLPGAAVIELVRDACRDLDLPFLGVQELVWSLPMTAALALHLLWDSSQTPALFSLSSAKGVHAAGSLMHPAPAPAKQALATLRARCPQALATPPFYQAFADRSIVYGAYFRSITQLARGDSEVLARVEVAGSPQDLGDFGWLTCLLDGAFQATGALAEADEDTLIPFALDEARMFGAIDAEAWVHVQERPQSKQDRTRQFDLALFNDEGHVLVQIKGFTVRALTQRAKRQQVQRPTTAHPLLQRVPTHPLFDLHETL